MYNNDRIWSWLNLVYKKKLSETIEEVDLKNID